MKNENKEKKISEFAGLKSKMFSLIIMGSEEIKNAKGVNKNAVKNVRDEEYLNVLFNKKLK